MSGVYTTIQHPYTVVGVFDDDGSQFAYFVHAENPQKALEAAEKQAEDAAVGLSDELLFAAVFKGHIQPVDMGE